MRKQPNYSYSSTLAPFIEGLIAERRASGFMYCFAEYALKDIDTFCNENNYISTTITKELVDKWSILREDEGLNGRKNRVTILRQLSKYIISLGETAYLPPSVESANHRLSHIFSPKERLEFFRALDSLAMKRNGKHTVVLLMESRVIFRLYYCCGLRFSEPLDLKWENVNLDEGWIKILQSKGYKDRILWLPEDILNMIREYRDKISIAIPMSEYVFPGTKHGGRISDNTVNTYFRRALAKTSCVNISNPPTIKSFRHTFVVDRLNQWIADGEDINKKLPYLCKFLGHSTIHETLYYYHGVEEAFNVIREKDKTSKVVIPEVIPYEV